MPDTMPSLPNGREITKQKIDIDIKAVEKRILSSTEHLNEILSLNNIVQVVRD